MTPLPVLVYHSVDDDPPAWLAPYTVSRTAFAEQLDTLLECGRVPVSAGQVAASRSGGPRLPDRAVAVTFDDGYLDFLRYALSELFVRAMPVTLFVTTGALAPRNRSLLRDAAMLSLQQVVRLDADGVEIGSHSHLHQQLDTLDAERVMWELTHPKQILEQALGHEVDLFSYPHGYSNAAVRRLTRSAGYSGAFARRNAFSPDDDDPYRIARLTVQANTPPFRFDDWMNGTGAPVAAAHDSAATVAWRFYRRARVRLLPSTTPESR